MIFDVFSKGIYITGLPGCPRFALVDAGFETFRIKSIGPSGAKWPSSISCEMSIG